MSLSRLSHQYHGWESGKALGQAKASSFPFLGRTAVFVPSRVFSWQPLWRHIRSVVWSGPLWNKLATQRGTFMTDPDPVDYGYRG